MCWAGLTAGFTLYGGERYQLPVSHRVEQTINRDWTFNYFPDDNADSNGCQAPDFDDSTWPAIALPHTWSTYETTGKLHPFIHDASEKSDSYWWRGWGWYRKHFSISNEETGRRVYVEFDGVQKYCKVWVNGQFVGDHKGGYTSFYFDITDLVHIDGENVLAVAVNADQNDVFKIPPMSAGNWNTYGGIYRDARIVIKDPLNIPFQGSSKQEGGTFVTTPQVSDNSGVVEIKTWVQNDYPQPRQCVLRTTIADADGNIIQSLTTPNTIQPGELAEFDQTSQPVSNPHLWSPETPYVYRVYSDVFDGTTPVDHFESPLGFRWFKWDYDENRLILNGKKVIIHGTNHHQEWPWLGDATPKWLLLADFLDIRNNLNVNFMRTVHYPNDPAIYNFTDHHGIIVIEEQPNDKRQAFSEEVQAQMLRETIRRDRNHPSIFIWSMGNETDHAVDSKYAVAEDTNRIIYARSIYNDSAGKYATLTDKQLPIESMLRCTIRGWYNSDVRNLEPQSAQQAGNEEWQHDKAASEFISRNQNRAPDDLANLCTWIYEDHGCDRDYVNCPLLKVNPKGWVDCWRMPKYMYYLWQAWYLPKPMVYIHPYEWTPSYLGQKREIVVDSNCQAVELQVNNRSIGILKPSLAEANVVRFENVPIEGGVLTAIGTRDAQLVTNTIIMSGPPESLVVSATPTMLGAALDSLAVIHADIVDANGIHVYGATNTIYWAVSGPAKLVGAPVYQTDIYKDEATEGAMYIDTPALNIIRSTGQPGEITVRVQSPGLASAVVTITATNLTVDTASPIVQLVLPQTNRRPVARENNSMQKGELVVQEMKDVSDDTSFKSGNLEGYARQIDLMLHAKNPNLDFNSPEYRAVVLAFARLAQNNHGNLIRDDFNFMVGIYNNCRQITRQIARLNLPELYKQSLREYYARVMIQQGESKDSDTELHWLNTLPEGKLVVAGVPAGTVREPGVIYTDDPDFEKMVALVLPKFRNLDAANKAELLDEVCSVNVNVRREVVKVRGKKINGVRQPGTRTVNYLVTKGQPILVPDRNYLAEAMKKMVDEQDQN